jgi:hypothetical protein
MQTAKRRLVLALTVCLAGWLTSASTVARGDASEPDKALQPQGLNHVGVYALRRIEPGLTGSGVKFALICRSMTYDKGEPQNDYRPNVEHKCLRADQFNFYDLGQLPPSISPHSTAICSILFGEDPDAFNLHLGPFYYQGAAPQAQANIHELWHFVTNNVFPNVAPDADVVTISFGSTFENWWTRGIESLAEHCGAIVVASIGNGSNSHDPPLYPGAGPNVIAVGVVDSVNTESLAASLAHFALAYPQHSSSGPTADGRCKPDMVAPGNCLAASAADPDLYELTGNWSSFSTPVTAGTVGLLVQKAKQEPSLSLALSPNGGNCVMKAILMNSATKLPYWHKGRLGSEDDHAVPLDYAQGAGMLNAISAYEHLVAGRNKPGDVSSTGWDLNQLDRQSTLGNVYRITVTEPMDKLITVTLVWNRHYSRAYPFEPDAAKDSNLRLELRAIDPENPDNDQLFYSDSTVDNVEHIYCRPPAAYTNYEILVSYSDIENGSQADATQRYGLAWTVGQSQGSDNIFWHDLNADGVVNELDFTVLVDNWVASIKSPESYLLGDINADGAIDLSDLENFLYHRNRQADWRTQQNSKSE